MKALGHPQAAKSRNSPAHVYPTINRTLGSSSATMSARCLAPRARGLRAGRELNAESTVVVRVSRERPRTSGQSAIAYPLVVRRDDGAALDLAVVQQVVGVRRAVEREVFDEHLDLSGLSQRDDLDQFGDGPPER